MVGVGFLPAYQEPYAATGQLIWVKGMQDRASTEPAREALGSQIRAVMWHCPLGVRGHSYGLSPCVLQVTPCHQGHGLLDGSKAKQPSPPAPTRSHQHSLQGQCLEPRHWGNPSFSNNLHRYLLET